MMALLDTATQAADLAQENIVFKGIEFEAFKNGFGFCCGRRAEWERIAKIWHNL